MESDSAILVEMINKGLDDLHRLKAMIERCKFYRERLSGCEVRHMFREVNMVEYFLQPPPHVPNTLLDDLCETPRSSAI